MAYTMEDFRKDYVKENLGVLSPDDRLQGLSPDEVLKRFSSDEVLNKFSIEEIQRYLEKKQRKESN